MAGNKSADGNGGEVVINVAGQETLKDPKHSSSSRERALPEETASVNHSASAKPPKIPTTNINEGPVLRKTLSRSVFSKPKSRFVEQPCNITKIEEHGSSLKEHYDVNSFSRSSFSNQSGRSIGSQIARLMPSSSRVVEDKVHDEDMEIYMKVKSKKLKKKRVNKLVMLEFIILLCTIGVLVGCLIFHKMKKHVHWGLEVWKWCVLVIVIFSGRLVTKWCVHFAVFFIEKNFLLRNKVLYFVHGLKKRVQVFIWLCLVLVTWMVLFKRRVRHEASETTINILNLVTRTLASILIGAFLCLLSTLSLKILASNFNLSNFFDRIQESIFNQYVLQTLSGPPLIEEAERVGREPSTGQLSFTSVTKGKEKKEKKVIDVGKIHQMKQEKVSAGTMKVLVEAVVSSGISTISSSLHESAIVEGTDQNDKEITSEMEAIAAAYEIFRNVAPPGHGFIEEDDLLRFMIKEEVDLLLPQIEGDERGRITRQALKDWVVKVYNSRKILAHSLNDTKTAIRQLHKVVTGILIIATFLIWLILTEIASTKLMILIGSKLVLLSFCFGGSCKNLFESIMFVFVMHPFDVGDRCLVDGVTMQVEEMNLLTTVFLKLDNEKVFYPNSVLSTKPISNYFRSPEMGDTIEFSIDFATPVEKIALLKQRIKNYLEENPLHWQPAHTVVVKEIENVNKLKMALYSNHTLNFQEWREKNLRRTELVLAIKKMFEELDIKYYLLPQKVHLSHTES